LTQARVAAHLGEHGREILQELGYSETDIQSLCQAQVLKI